MSIYILVYIYFLAILKIMPSPAFCTPFFCFPPPFTPLLQSAFFLASNNPIPNEVLFISQSWRPLLCFAALDVRQVFETFARGPPYRACGVFHFVSQRKAGGRRPGGDRTLCAQGPRQEGSGGQGSAGAREGRKVAPPEHVSPLDPGAVLYVSGSSMRTGMNIIE